MAKVMNVGVGGVSRVAKNGYIGVNGVAREFAGGMDIPIREITLTNPGKYSHDISYYDAEKGEIIETNLSGTSTMKIYLPAGAAIYVYSFYGYAHVVTVTPEEYVKLSMMDEDYTKKMIMIQ